MGVHIYDKEVVDSTNVLLVWFDDRGRVMVYARLLGVEKLQAADVLIWNG